MRGRRRRWIVSFLVLSAACLACASLDDVPGDFFLDPATFAAENFDDDDDLINDEGGGFAVSHERSQVVVTTVVSAAPPLDDWIRHHLSVVGFDRAIVFLDDGGSADSEAMASIRAEWGSAVLFVRRGAALTRELETLDLYDKFGGFYPFEVQARQLLHLSLVANRSEALAVDWALHVDLDELWVPPADEDAETHFAMLSASGATQAVYANVEALPRAEDVPAGVSPFAVVTDFLRSELCLARRDQFRETRRVRALRDKLGVGGVFFQGYWVGKIASRVSTGTIVPHDVTRNAVPEEHRDATRIAVFDDTGGPVILHYINPGPESWRLKHARLGQISDVSFDPDRVEPEFLRARPHARRSFPRATRQLPFSRISRDLVSAAAGDRDAARKAYVDKIVIPFESESALRSSGALVRVTDVARAVRRWHRNDPHYAHESFQSLEPTSPGFRPDVSADVTTCNGWPHFMCRTRSISCCRLLASPAFLFLKKQLGYF